MEFVHSIICLHQALKQVAAKGPKRQCCKDAPCTGLLQEHPSLKVMLARAA